MEPHNDEKYLLIRQLDFCRLKEKMMLDLGWGQDEADLRESLYRNFLWLKAKYEPERPIPPNYEIDVFWHNHILDTRKYFKDCEMIFGSYGHHYPYASLPGDSITREQLVDYFNNNTQALHYENFGYYIYDVSPSFSNIIKTLFKRRFYNAKYKSSMLQK